VSLHLSLISCLEWQLARSKIKGPGGNVLFFIFNNLMKPYKHIWVIRYRPDIVCLVCGEGEFINWNKCPSTFHRSCAYMHIIIISDIVCLVCERWEGEGEFINCSKCLFLRQWNCLFQLSEAFWCHLVSDEL
jgi:hypothetical protein